MGSGSWKTSHDALPCNTRLLLPCLSLKIRSLLTCGPGPAHKCSVGLDLDVVAKDQVSVGGVQVTPLPPVVERQCSRVSDPVPPHATISTLSGASNPVSLCVNVSIFISGLLLRYLQKVSCETLKEFC